MKVLVVDVGGSHVKVATAPDGQARRFDSTPGLGPSELVQRLNELTSDLRFDVVSIGYPGAVGPAGPSAEPGNLGGGWLGFDFERALGRPVRVANDAAMQALGAYDGGRMLFLGLGTGLGSTLVTERVIVPLELGELLHPSGDNLAQRLGKAGLEREGEAAWQRAVIETAQVLRRAFAADYIVLGGGNASRIDPLPRNVRRGGNDDAVIGGYRLWQEPVDPHDREPAPFWRVVQ